ncbi:hypothetical protein N9J83_09325 [Opitutales bacterium]|nr:hypothetical protein [Opitutales bacterium]
MNFFKFAKREKFKLLGLFGVFFLGGCSNEEEVSTERLEYRKDEKGIVRLHYAGEDEPVGKWKFARVIENHSNGEKKFEIGVVDGLRHGSFFFWQSNGLKKLTGFFERGKREGSFRAYGKAGELLYEKNYFEDELEGNMSFYYPMSNAEIFRYFNKLREDGLKPGEIPVKNNIRLEATFSKGIPTGPYRTYFHPRGHPFLTKADLLEEEGRFDAQGRLIGNQVCYYPRTEGLVVYLPDNKPLETIHEPNSFGLSKAIDECYLAIEEIPAYRNPKNLPAKVFCVDIRGGKISPVWSSEIVELAVRNMDGNILPGRYPANFEAYRDQAVKKAKEVVLTQDLSDDPNLLSLTSRGAAVQVIALNKNGEIRDILWSNLNRKNNLDLEQRILKKRKRIHRSWDAGDATASEWTISSGLNLIIRDDPSDPQNDPYLQLKGL